MKLYILHYRKDVSKALEGYEFWRITPNYALCYTDKDPPEHSAQIFDEDLGKLTKSDRMWLHDANLAILEVTAKRYEAEIKEAQERFLKEFSQQIERIRGDMVGNDGTPQTDAEGERGHGAGEAV